MDLPDRAMVSPTAPRICPTGVAAIGIPVMLIAMAVSLA
jgi:hypothetical protein